MHRPFPRTRHTHVAHVVALAVALEACGAPSSVSALSFSRGAPPPRPLIVVTHDAPDGEVESPPTESGATVAAGGRAYRWPRRGALRLYVQPASRIEGFTARHLVLADEAVHAWTEAGAVRVERVYRPQEADIALFWTDQLPPTNPGLTLLSRRDPRMLNRAEVFIRVAPAPWNTGTPDRVLYGTIAHELGHALGLPHDPSVDALMHAAPLVTRVTERDLEQLTELTGGR